MNYAKLILVEELARLQKLKVDIVNDPNQYPIVLERIGEIEGVLKYIDMYKEINNYLCSQYSISGLVDKDYPNHNDEYEKLLWWWEHDNDLRKKMHTMGYPKSIGDKRR